MKFDKFGQVYTTEEELCDLLYQNPDLDISRFMVEDPGRYNQSREQTYSDLPILKRYVPIDYKDDVPVELFDHAQQSRWHMPDEYKNLEDRKSTRLNSSH